MRNYIKQLAATAVATEVYRFVNVNNNVHTDNVEYIGDSVETLTDEQLENAWVELADEQYYNSTINANCGMTDDFAELYGDKEGKVLLVIIRL